MTAEEYQAWSKSTARYPQSFVDQSMYVWDDYKPKTFPFYLCLGLAGECGEVIEVFKKFARRNNTQLNQEEKEKAKLELGDLLWYYSQILTELGMTFSEVMEANKHKLEERYAGK